MKILIPDEVGAMISEEVQLDLKTREDLNQIIWSLANLVEPEERATTPALHSAQLLHLENSDLPNVAPPRRELLRTAIKLMRLRNLSISYVPGVKADANYHAVLLALYAMEGFESEITTARLQRATQVPASTLLRVLSVLEEDRLVSRRTSARDARHTLVALTMKARETLDLFFGAARDAMRS